MRLPDLGSRGQGWVAAQFVLFGLIGLAAVVTPNWPDGPASAALSWAGWVLATCGLALSVAALRSLGPALTPFPKPAGGTLVGHGPYSWVRHPIYSGLSLAALGLGLAQGPVTLALSLLLALVLGLKCQVEERFLTSHYASYVQYAAQVRWRLLPGVY